MKLETKVVQNLFGQKSIYRFFQRFLWKILGNASGNGIFSGKNLANSNANIDTKNILQYRVHEKYSTTSYIKTCHRFRSYFPRKAGNIMFSFKSNSKASNTEKIPVLPIAVLEIQDFRGKWHACT